MRYEFVLMHLGKEIGRESFNNYESARKFFYFEYFNYDRGCRVFVDGKELTIFEAYDYFNLLPLTLNYVWNKDLGYREYR